MKWTKHNKLSQYINAVSTYVYVYVFSHQVSTVSWFVQVYECHIMQGHSLLLPWCCKQTIYITLSKKLTYYCRMYNNEFISLQSGKRTNVGREKAEVQGQRPSLRKIGNTLERAWDACARRMGMLMFLFYFSLYTFFYNNKYYGMPHGGCIWRCTRLVSCHILIKGVYHHTLSLVYVIYSIKSWRAL